MHADRVSSCQRLSITDSVMFSKVDLEKKTEFLDRAKVAREERASERQRELSAVKIQAGFLSIISLCTMPQKGDTKLVVSSFSSYDVDL